MRERQRRHMQSGRLRALAVTLAGGVALALGGTLYATDALHRLELLTVDARFDIRGAKDPPPEIVVVGMDDETFNDYRERDVPYPLPRRLHAQVIERLVAADAKVIAYDVQFTEQGPSVRDDNALFEAVAAARGRIVLATTETEADGRTAVLGGDRALRRIGARAGHAAVVEDANGVVRRLPYELGGLESFAVVAAQIAAGRPVDATRFDDNGAWIDYHGPPGTLRVHSFSEVADGRIPPETFRDRIVVVGATAPSLQDQSATSTSGDEQMSGPEIQAESISTVLRGFPLQPVDRWTGWLLTLGLGAFPLVVGLRVRALRGLLAAFGLGALYAVAAQILFGEGTMLPIVTPLAALGASAVAVLVVRVVLEAFERQRVRDLFAHFVPAQVVDEVLRQADDELRLGGSRREVTVLFSDLRGFTTYSEHTPPDQVIEILNAYLSEMGDAILDRGGTLISYVGDGIMAVFGAPLDQPDHRDRALATAREMVARLERFNDRMREQGRATGFRMGIGINSGYAMCGNVGSERRLEYTVIGDTTNTASRIEGMTKGSGFSVFVAESTRAGLTEEHGDLQFVDELGIRGRSAKVRIWALSPTGAGEPEQRAVAQQAPPVAQPARADS
jgi:adenylate cyclase